MDSFAATFQKLISSANTRKQKKNTFTSHFFTLKPKQQLHEESIRLISGIIAAFLWMQ